MPRLPGRFRRPKAELRVELDESTPPDFSPGGVLSLRVTLIPQESSLLVTSGRLELVLLTTIFTRTVLDGYHEHVTERVCRIVTLCKGVRAQAGKELVRRAGLPLLEVPGRDDSRPARQQWQARARFQIDGRRELSAVRLLRDVSPPESGAPVVDGRGFLPLYEFRVDTTP